MLSNTFARVSRALCCGVTDQPALYAAVSQRVGAYMLIPTHAPMAPSCVMSLDVDEREADLITLPKGKNVWVCIPGSGRVRGVTRELF